MQYIGNISISIMPSSNSLNLSNDIITYIKKICQSQSSRSNIDIDKILSNASEILLLLVATGVCPDDFLKNVLISKSAKRNIKIPKLLRAYEDYVNVLSKRLLTNEEFGHVISLYFNQKGRSIIKTP